MPLLPTPHHPPPPADNILFSSNFFSAHTSLAGAGAAADGGGWDAYAADWRNYFDCMLAPVARQVATALDRLNINAMRSPEAAGGLAQVLAPLRRLTALVHELTLGADDGVAEPLAVAAVAPMHGPVVRQCLTELVGRYADWTAAQVEAAGQAAVAVLYASAYGNTASLAQAISRGITKAGGGWVGQPGGWSGSKAGAAGPCTCGNGRAGDPLPAALAPEGQRECGRLRCTPPTAPRPVPPARSGRGDAQPGAGGAG